MAGKFIRTDGGKYIRTGPPQTPPRQNPRLSARPEAGRAPNFRTGTSVSNQQSIAPPGSQTGSALTAAVGWIPGLSGLATALTVGQQLGTAYANSDRVPAVSGRGSGARTFSQPVSSSKPKQKPYRSSTGPQEVGGNYVVNGVTYDGTTHQAINDATGEISETGYSIDSNGNRVNTPKYTPSAPAPTRDVDAPDGSGSKGTQMSPKIDLAAANSLLGGLNLSSGGQPLKEMADANSFFSEQLPVSPSEKPELPQEAVPVTAGGGGMVVEGISLAGNGNGYTVSPESTPKGGKITAGYDGKTELSPIETADNNRSVSVPGEEVPADPKNSGTNWGIKQQPSFERARRDAFLDLNNRGYSAIRAADTATGRFRQGDKFFYNVGGELQEVNEDTYRQGQHRALSADELKAGYVDAIKPTLVPVDQPDVSEPYSSDDTAVMPEGDTPDIPEAAVPVTSIDTTDTEFNYNNAPPYSVDVDMKGKYFDKD